MSSTTEFAAFWMAVIVQVLGLASIAIARFTERSWARAFCQRLFFASLVSVGVVTLFSLHLGNGNWHPCAMMLGIMTVGATLGRSTPRRAASF